LKRAGQRAARGSGGFFQWISHFRKPTTRKLEGLLHAPQNPQPITGQSHRQGGYEIPHHPPDTIPWAADLRQIKVDPKEFGMMSTIRPSNNTASLHQRKKSTYIDGERRASFRHRGYSD